MLFVEQVRVKQREKDEPEQQKKTEPRLADARDRRRVYVCSQGSHGRTVATTGHRRRAPHNGA